MCNQGLHPLDLGTRERIDRQACFSMGRHDDEAASTRGIVDGGEDDGVQYPTVARENLHKFTPSHVVSGQRGYQIKYGHSLEQVKGQTKDIEVAPRVNLFGFSEESVICGSGRHCDGSFLTSETQA